MFKATIGLLINKARLDTAAEKLKEGDVTDEKFRSFIVREIDQINSKLDWHAKICCRVSAPSKKGSLFCSMYLTKKTKE